MKEDDLKKPPNGLGKERFTDSSCYGYVRWRPGGAKPEPSKPKEPENPLTKEEPYDVLHRGTK
jgi:hypothetical protein